MSNDNNSLDITRPGNIEETVAAIQIQQAETLQFIGSFQSNYYKITETVYGATRDFTKGQLLNPLTKTKYLGELLDYANSGVVGKIDPIVKVLEAVDATPLEKLLAGKAYTELRNTTAGELLPSIDSFDLPDEAKTALKVTFNGLSELDPVSKDLLDKANAIEEYYNNAADVLLKDSAALLVPFANNTVYQQALAV